MHSLKGMCGDWTAQVAIERASEEGWTGEELSRYDVFSISCILLLRHQNRPQFLLFKSTRCMLQFCCCCKRAFGTSLTYDVMQLQ